VFTGQPLSRWSAACAKRAEKIHLGVRGVLGVLSLCVACSGGAGLFKQYEYEEEMTLSLDGSATLYVNSSLAALNALRGTDFDIAAARVDREAVRRYFTAPSIRVVRVTESRRSGRRFVHVRLEVDDIRKLGAAAPFAWSSYSFERKGKQYIYQQAVGAAAARDVGKVGWTGQELIAFRMHLPSKIDYHNTPTHEVGRGNILSWEQSLGDRMKGVPLDLEARIETQSILYRTLWLFGLTVAAVALLFVAIVWWIVGRGKTPSVPRPAE
jgi:hypothetical protein